tara:strand:- start:67 stop:243 length:177 start_codon:yes stop_codon:yes gene_type:complete
MQFEKNTSRAKSKNFLVKVILISAIIISVVIMLGKIDFPSPNKEIKKNIPNENLKIVK